MGHSVADSTPCVRRAARPPTRRRIGRYAPLWVALLLANGGCARGARSTRARAQESEESASPGVAPAGDAALGAALPCSERDATSSSGRDAGRARQDARPSPVAIRVRNATGAPLFFALTARTAPRFDIYADDGGQRRRLELPENQFCPTACPDAGPAAERDCRKPAPLLYRLMPGEQRDLRWSGTAQVRKLRSCGGAPAVPCVRTYAAPAGPYVLEVCARTGALGGRPQPRDPNLLLGATPQGEELCGSAELHHPRTTSVRIDLLTSRNGSKGTTP